MRLTQKVSTFFVILVITLFSACVLAGEAEYRAAWLAFVQPALDPVNYSSSVHQHRAREAAIAALGDPGRDAAALEASGYFHLRDFQYRKAKDLFGAAAKRRSSEPRLRYLLGQVKGILLLAEPTKMRENCKDPIEEFRRAAKDDANNAMPLLQAASMAFDCDRYDLALPLVEEALGKTAFKLYEIPIPQDLTGNRAQSAAVWWWVQSEQWKEPVSRTINCSNRLLQRADKAAATGEEEKALELSRQAAQVASLLYRCEPSLGMAASSGLAAEGKAWRVYLANASQAAPDIQAEAAERLAKVDKAQQDLNYSWRALAAEERQKPPESATEYLSNQKRLVETALGEF